MATENFLYFLKKDLVSVNFVAIVVAVVIGVVIVVVSVVIVVIVVRKLPFPRLSSFF